MRAQDDPIVGVLEQTVAFWRWYRESGPLSALTSPAEAIDREEVLAFALKWDPLPIHVDEAVGAAAFGSLTAPGFQGSSCWRSSGQAVKLRLIPWSAPCTFAVGGGRERALISHGSNRALSGLRPQARARRALTKVATGDANRARQSKGVARSPRAPSSNGNKNQEGDDADNGEHDGHIPVQCGLVSLVQRFDLGSRLPLAVCFVHEDGCVISPAR